MSKTDELADLAAERSLLGACLLSEAAIDVAGSVLVPSDFRLLRHQQVFAVMIEMRENGERIDVVTVAAKFDTHDALEFLHELQNVTPSISAAREYAEIIASWSLRRKLIVAGSNITEMGYGRSHPELDPQSLVQEAQGLLADIDLPPGVVEPDTDVDSFIEDTNITHDWLIPGFIERRDRMLVTGFEGSGKTWLLRQIAMKAAVGIHPWSESQRVPPINVLLVDCENSARQIARSMTVMKQTAGDFDASRLRVISRPAGLNLTSRADKRWLVERCQANNADLLIIGPSYRLSSGVPERGDIGGEDQARKVTAALDEVRIHCNVALLLETHAAHGASTQSRDLRPFGSSVWLRWPEFGIGIRPVDPENTTEFVLEHWRGPRDEREWPRKLAKYAGRWPWTPVDGFYRR